VEGKHKRAVAHLNVVPETMKNRPVPVPPLKERESDASLEEINQLFWGSLLGLIQLDQPRPVRTLLDIGCDHGGMLARFAGALHPEHLIGIEPSTPARERARFRLRDFRNVRLIDPDQWGDIATGSVDLVTCHEVLHLVDDDSQLFDQIARTLSPQGSAYIVAGCHTENPLWARWRQHLIDEGAMVFDREPFAILRSGQKAGLKGALRPLRRDGWVIYDPDQATYRYNTTRELFDHHYRHKILFRFVKQP